MFRFSEFTNLVENGLTSKLRKRLADPNLTEVKDDPRCPGLLFPNYAKPNVRQLLRQILDFENGRDGSISRILVILVPYISKFLCSCEHLNNRPLPSLPTPSFAHNVPSHVIVTPVARVRSAISSCIAKSQSLRTIPFGFTWRALLYVLVLYSVFFFH